MSDSFDIAIIGAGPGGYVAALQAAENGLKVACIDSRSLLGGTCLHEGCIPSKALLETTAFFFDIKKTAGEIKCSDAQIDFAALMKKKRETIQLLEGGIQQLFHHSRVTFIAGRASFFNAHTLLIATEKGERKIEARYILIATGSYPVGIEQAPFDARRIISSSEALSLSQVPKRLAVLGGGAIGLELASIYNRLGSKVSIIEMMDRLSPNLDFSLSRALKSTLESQGISFALSSQLVSALSLENEVALTIANQGQLQALSVDYLLVAVGRKPFTMGLQIESVGIACDAKGFIKVDSSFRTSLPHVFAIGDVIGGPMLAHKASAEAVSVVNSLKGVFQPVSYIAIPSVIYTEPEVASVGLSEEEVKESGLGCVIGQSYFKANPRARCSGQTDGFVKLIAEKSTKRLLGAHIIAPHASELIAQVCLAMQAQLSLDDIARAPQAHPTLSEALKEAALLAMRKTL